MIVGAGPEPHPKSQPQSRSQLRSQVRSLSEFDVVVMAAGVACACRWPTPLAIGPVLVAVVVALALGRPGLVIVAVVALASARGAMVEAAHTDLVPQTWDGAVRLLTDPEESRFGFVGEGRLLDGADEGARVRLSFDWSLGSEIANAHAGESFHIVGRLKPIDQNGWTRSRHLRGQLSVEIADQVATSPTWQQPSELLRGLVERGASGVPVGLRSLYVGLVIGDDREQSLAQQAEFRSSGLSHLLAVSGQNVAFVLAVAAPLTRRAGRANRLVITIGLLLVFAVATRLEPSVVRATVSAGIAAGSVLMGRQSLGVRTLALTVTVLLIIDPFLVWSIGFQLSVLASAGIVVAGPAAIARSPGPRWLAEAVGITLAAQLFVAPLLVSTFGPISLVSIPANVLVGWAAGAVMTWGLTGGVVAGLLPTGWSRVMSLPATALVWWIDAVAGWAVALPLPRVGLLGLVVGLCGWMAMASTKSLTMRSITIAGLIAVGAAAVPRPPPEATLARGVTWISGSAATPSVLILESSASTAAVEAMIHHGIRSVDVVIIEYGNRSTSRLVADLSEVVDLGLVLAPPQHRVVGGRRVLQTATITTRTSVIELTPADERLLIETTE